jgi:hypothetical protein
VARLITPNPFYYFWGVTTDQLIETDNRDIDELTTDQFMNAGKKI